MMFRSILAASVLALTLAGATVATTSSAQAHEHHGNHFWWSYQSYNPYYVPYYNPYFYGNGFCHYC